MLTGRRYRLEFTQRQRDQAEQFGVICRAVWNIGLEQRREYRRRGAWISYVEQARQLAEAKNDEHGAWLADAPSHVLQQTLRDLDKACRTHGAWRVHWRSKTRTPPSFRFPDPKQIEVRRLSRRWGEVKLPKLGWVRLRWTRPLGGTIRNATVSLDGGRWYVSLCVEDGVSEVAASGKPPVGVDRGVQVAVATSEGDLYDRALVTPGEQQRLRRLRQCLSRSLRVRGRGRGSKRREGVRAELGRLNARIRARRADFAAQTAHRLVSAHGMVVVEDLKVKNMTAAAKGTIGQPGRHVRAKAGLNRAILAKGWGGFLLAVQSAGRYHGCAVVTVDPAYTSQTCNACGYVAAENRESQAVFRCVACGNMLHADVNAARNILGRGIELVSAAGRAVAGRGDLDAGRSVKRQPPELVPA